MGLPKVYWKGLIIAARLLVHYIQRNQVGLSHNLSEEQYACVTALLDAGVTCLAALPENTPT